MTPDKNYIVTIAKVLLGTLLHQRGCSGSMFALGLLHYLLF